MSRNDGSNREHAERPERVERAERAERERNERVIHTRVPESLETELKEQAANLGVSVSNLVRNVLANAFGLVEDIMADSERLARSARTSVEAGVRAVRSPFAGGVTGSAEPAGDDRRGPAAEPTVIGWQELVLNLNAICTRCNDILPRGGAAAIAIVDGAASRPILCLRCLEELRHGPADPRTQASSDRPGDRPSDRADRDAE